MVNSGGASETTLAGIFLNTANMAPNHGIGYIQDKRQTTFQTYRDLLTESCGILNGLQKAGIKPGDIIILALSGNRDFIPAFWACMLGGIIPVPVPAPASYDFCGPALERLKNVWQTLEKPLIVFSGTPGKTSSRNGDISGIPEGKLLGIKDLADNDISENFHPAHEKDIAFIQFSSGSTGNPKGVCLSHRNILSNLEAIAPGLKMNKKDLCLSWMPLYHDMGLIGFHLVPLHFKMDHFLMDTHAFVRNPLLWLESLERHKATIAGAPGFSQAMVLKHLERKKSSSWDLSAVRLILNGAEPISADIMTRFCAKMSEFGLKNEAMFPVYGLAEATLAVTFPEVGTMPGIETLRRHLLQDQGKAVPADSDDPSPVTFVRVGKPLKDCEIRIVDDRDQLLQEGRVGHLQIRGANVTGGYFNNPEETDQSFCGTWLRTGDMGYIRDESLVVTGRAKNIIFVNGRNLYSEDLEQIAGRINGIDIRKIAVCGSFDRESGRDRILLFFRGSLTEKNADIMSGARQVLQEKAGVLIDIFVPAGSAPFPRTSSGKLQRFRLVQQYEQGEFDELISRFKSFFKGEGNKRIKVPPQTTNEKLIHGIWCRELMLKPEEVGMHDHFADLGGTSLNAITIITRLEKRYNIQINSENLAEYPTIASISGYLEKHPMLQTGKGKRKGVFKG